MATKGVAMRSIELEAVFSVSDERSLANGLNVGMVGCFIRRQLFYLGVHIKLTPELSSYEPGVNAYRRQCSR